MIWGSWGHEWMQLVKNLWYSFAGGGKSAPKKFVLLKVMEKKAQKTSTKNLGIGSQRPG